MAQLGLHIMGPSWVISCNPALDLNHLFYQSSGPDEKDPLAEILPAPSIILQMDQLSRGLSRFPKVCQVALSSNKLSKIRLLT